MPNSAIKNESRKLSQDLSRFTKFRVMEARWVVLGVTIFFLYLRAIRGAEVQYVDRDGTLRTYIPLPINAGGFEISGSNSLLNQRC